MSEKLLDKVTKMLAQAASARHIGSQPEAEAFAARAAELLREHNLTMDDVEAHARAQEPVGGEPVHAAERPLPIWQRQLLTVLSDINGCTFVENEADVAFLIGRRDDRKIIQGFFSYFKDIGTRLGAEFKDAFVSTLDYSVNGLAGFENAHYSYMVGFAVGVSRSLKRAYGPKIEDRLSTQTDQALVFVERRAKEAMSWLTERSEVVEREPEVPPIDQGFMEVGLAHGERTALTDKVLA